MNRIQYLDYDINDCQKIFMVLSHQSHSFWSTIISCTVHTTPHRSACPGCREQFRVLLSDVEHCAFYAQSSELRVLMLSMSVEILPSHSGQAGPTHPSPPVIHYPSHHSFRLITKEYKDKVIVCALKIERTHFIMSNRNIM